MTSEEYRKKLNDIGWTYRLMCFLQELKLTGKYDFLLNALKDSSFHKSASIEELYKFDWELFQLLAMFYGIHKEISEIGVLHIGEFEDKVITPEEIGITSKIFECVANFTDEFSQLEICQGTIIEVVDIAFASSANNKVAAIYKDLKTSSNNSKLIDIFKDGKQKTILSLKILEVNFKQK